MNLIKLIPVGLVASGVISFFSPISANADSIFVEGQLIAGAGNPSACEAKGKVWKSASKNWTNGQCRNLDKGCSKGAKKIGNGEYTCAVADRDCSCQES